jgi:hypothetical protein
MLKVFDNGWSASRWYSGVHFRYFPIDDPFRQETFSHSGHCPVGGHTPTFEFGLLAAQRPLALATAVTKTTHRSTGIRGSCPSGAGDARSGRGWQ